MSIQKTDIKLMASQRLTDYYDGGGQMTGTEISDGVVNNLFPDISRLDRVYGRVSLRKAFPAVMTDNTDMYYGCHVIITDPPDDDNVHTTLFTREDFYDQRDDAKDRIESYVSIAQELLWRLLNDQLEGQRAITAFAKPGTTRPEIGDTIVLKNATTGEQQYVRITSLEAENATFAHVNYGIFTVEVLTLGLSAALQHTFPGIEATPYTTKATTRIHATIVADASSYYGVSRLAQPATAGDMSLWVNSIYNQLVPTSQIETALVDQLMGGDRYTMYPLAGGNNISYSLSRTQDSATIHLPVGVMPGSLSLSVGGATFRDKGGTLLATSESDAGFSGTIDYRTGQIALENSAGWSSTVTITATAAVAVVESYVTREIYIDLANRAYNYVPVLDAPLPQPGSITVDYMAQGSWYRLRDDGQGVLYGDEQGIGTGTIDYASGSAIITLGALPDVGSSIIVSWGHGSTVTQRSGSDSLRPLYVRKKLEHEGVAPSSVTITWGESGEYSLSDDGGGNLTGDGLGVISYTAGEIVFLPNPLPASGATFHIAYQQQNIENFATPGKSSFTLPNAPIRPKSVHLQWNCRRILSQAEDGSQVWGHKTYVATDDGLGDLFAVVPSLDNGREVNSNTKVGSVDYATGDVTIDLVHDYTYTKHYTTTTTSTSWQRIPV